MIRALSLWYILLIGAAIAQGTERTLLISENSSARISLDGIIEKWKSPHDRLSRRNVSERAFQFSRYLDFGYTQDEGVRVSGQLSSSRVDCQFPSSGINCRTLVGNSEMPGILVHDGSMRRISATEISFLFASWLHAMDYKPEHTVFPAPFATYQRQVLGREAVTVGLGLGLVRASQLPNAETIFQAVLNLHNNGEVFQCRSDIGVCHQVWRLTSVSEADNNRHLYAVCKLMSGVTGLGLIPFDCIPLSLRERDGQVYFLAALEYYVIDGVGGTDFVGALTLSAQLSERHLRELVSAAAVTLGLPPTRGEVSARRLISQTAGAVRTPGTSEWVSREFLVTYRQTLGDEDWSIDVFVQTAFSPFRGSAYLRLGTASEDRRALEAFLRSIRQHCRERAAQTSCRVVD